MVMTIVQKAGDEYGLIRIENKNGTYADGAYIEDAENIVSVLAKTLPALTFAEVARILDEE